VPGGGDGPGIRAAGALGNVPGLGRGQIMAYRDEGDVKRDELATVTADRI